MSVSQMPSSRRWKQLNDLERLVEEIEVGTGVEPEPSELLDQWMLRVIIALMDRVERLEHPRMH